MTTKTIAEQVRWQDLKVRSEVDIVLEIAKTKGWEDCEIFGYGDMITEPQQSKGWKLIPADQYKYSIPMQAVERLHQIINAGIRVQGVIIADDERGAEPAPVAAKPKVSLPSMKPIVSWIGNALNGFIDRVKAIVSFSGKALLALIRAVIVIAIVSLAGIALIHFWPIALVGLVIFAIANAGPSIGTNVEYDPKLVILVDDRQGDTAWISLFTWYE